MRLLAIDVGMGTTDILVYDSETGMENCFRLVVPSATRVVAQQIIRATESGLPIIFSGVTMGGGPCSKALRRHLESGLDFYATPAAALTFNDDLELVSSWGVRLIDETGSNAPADAVRIQSGDVDLESLLEVLDRLGIYTGFDGAAVAVQDHGFAPGVSNRRCRFALWREALAAGACLDNLAWNADAVPGHYTRMGAAAGLLKTLGKVVVMDTGPAALMGVLRAGEPGPVVAVNVGNGHTLAAVIDGMCISALVEHHTGMLDPESLKSMLERFIAGSLTDEQVFSEGGHGCITPPGPVAPAGPIRVTGPRREMFSRTGLKHEMAAPYGDMMLTGCFGLVEAWKGVSAGPSS